MTSRFNLTTAVVGTVLGLMLAACSDNPGNTPTTTAPPVTTPSLPDSGAPKVENPLDTARFETEPCSVSPLAALEKAGMEFRKAEEEPGFTAGPRCKWFYRQDRYGVISGTFTAISDRGLSDLYDQRDEWAYFQELTIAGYPAVMYDGIERRDTGDCPLAVGIRDDQTYDITASLDTQHPNRKDPCKVAKAFVEIALKTMKLAQS